MLLFSLHCSGCRMYCWIQQQKEQKQSKQSNTCGFETEYYLFVKRPLNVQSTHAFCLSLFFSIYFVANWKKKKKHVFSNYDSCAISLRHEWQLHSFPLHMTCTGYRAHCSLLTSHGYFQLKVESEMLKIVLNSYLGWFRLLITYVNWWPGIRFDGVSSSPHNWFRLHGMRRKKSSVFFGWHVRSNANWSMVENIRWHASSRSINDRLPYSGKKLYLSSTANVILTGNCSLDVMLPYM